MDRDLIEEKLEILRRCIKRIEDKCPDTSKDLAKDADLQDIVSLNLTRAVQICVDIASHIIADTEAKPPDTMAGAFMTLADIKIITPELAEQMRKAVGFRNIAVHNYQEIDWEIVFSICSDNVADFRAFAKAVDKE